MKLTHSWVDHFGSGSAWRRFFAISLIKSLLVLIAFTAFNRRRPALLLATLQPCSVSVFISSSASVSSAGGAWPGISTNWLGSLKRAGISRRRCGRALGMLVCAGL